MNPPSSVSHAGSDPTKVVLLLKNIMDLDAVDRAALVAAWSAVDPSYSEPRPHQKDSFVVESTQEATDADERHLEALKALVRGALDLPAIQRGLELNRIGRGLLYEEELSVYNALVAEKAKRSIPFSMEIAVSKVVAEKPLYAVLAIVGLIFMLAKILLMSWHFVYPK